MPRKAALGKLDIAALRVVEPLGPAQKPRFREADIAVVDQVRLDAFFNLVGEFVAIRAEQLDAVILERIMGGGDHDPNIRAQRAGQHGNRRGRQRSDQNHIHPDGRKTRRQRRFQHIAGQAGVLADNDAMTEIPAPRKLSARGFTDFQRDFGGHRILVRRAANAVRSKIFPCHTLLYRS